MSFGIYYFIFMYTVKTDFKIVVRIKGGKGCFRFVFEREPAKSAVNPRFKTSQEDAFEIGQDIDK